MKIFIKCGKTEFSITTPDSSAKDYDPLCGEYTLATSQSVLLKSISHVCKEVGLLEEKRAKTYD